MTNTEMTPIRNTISTHGPKIRNRRGRRSADADACPFPYQCVFRPSCWSVFAKPPRMMTAPYRRGFAGQWSTNWRAELMHTPVPFSSPRPMMPTGHR